VDWLVRWTVKHNLWEVPTWEVVETLIKPATQGDEYLRVHTFTPSVTLPRSSPASPRITRLFALPCPESPRHHAPRLLTLDWRCMVLTSVNSFSPTSVTQVPLAGGSPLLLLALTPITLPVVLMVSIWARPPCSTAVPLR
jgi:hypothetical protein